MARSVDDLRLALQIIAGPDVSDPNVPPVPWREVPQLELHALRIAWTATFPGMLVAHDIRVAIEKLANDLAELGAQVQSCLPAVDFTVLHQMKDRLFGGLVGAFGEAPMSLAHYLTILQEREAVIAAWERFFEVWDVLIFPAGPTTAELLAEPTRKIDGVEVMFDPCGDLAAVSGCPTVTIPLSRDQHGLPIGVQLMSRRWSDERLLTIAERLSDITGGFQRPPGY